MRSIAESYSPNILIYFEIGEQRIRLSDVLCENATLYDSEFSEVPPGVPAHLVVLVGDEEERQLVFLDHGVSKQSSVIHFSYPTDKDALDSEIAF